MSHLSISTSASSFIAAFHFLLLICPPVTPRKTPTRAALPPIVTIRVEMKVVVEIIKEEEVRTPRVVMRVDPAAAMKGTAIPPVITIAVVVRVAAVAILRPFLNLAPKDFFLFKSATSVQRVK